MGKNATKKANTVDVVAMAQRRRRVYLLEKIRNNELLSVAEISELRMYERLTKLKKM